MKKTFTSLLCFFNLLEFIKNKEEVSTFCANVATFDPPLWAGFHEKQNNFKFLKIQSNNCYKLIFQKIMTILCEKI